MGIFNLFNRDKVKSQEIETKNISEFQLDNSVLENIKDEYKKARYGAEEALKIIQKEHPNYEFEIIYKGKTDSKHEFIISGVNVENLISECEDELSWDIMKDIEMIELGKFKYSEIFKAQVLDVFIRIDKIVIGRDLRKLEVLTYLNNFIKNQENLDLIIVDESEDIIMRNGFKCYSYKLAINTSTVINKRSRTISQHIKDAVWKRDGGCCVVCGSNENIEFDHIIPFSKGGSNSYRNIQILCMVCNRRKSAKIG